MNCQEAGALFSARVDDELDGHATAAVDAHVAGCAKCRADFERLTALRAAVARACRPVVAPEALRAAVLAGLRATPRVRPGRWQWLLAAPGVAALLLGLWIVLSEPWQPAALPDGSRVVYHVASADNVDAILRTLRNHLDASPGVRVVVVAHNNGIEFLLESARDGSGRPYTPVLQEFRDRGVEFRVCANTLDRRRIDTRAVVPQAALVPSGIAEINRLQASEGYTYLRL